MDILPFNVESHHCQGVAFRILLVPCVNSSGWPRRSDAGAKAVWRFDPSPKRATKASEFRQETGDVVVSVAFCLMSRRSGDQGWVGCQQDCALQTEGTDFNKSQRLLTHKRFLVWKDYCT